MLNVIAVCVILSLLGADLYCNRRPAEPALEDYDYR